MMSSFKPFVRDELFLSGKPPATLFGDVLPDSISEGVEHHMCDREVTMMLGMCFDPSQIPQDFDFNRHGEDIRREVAKGPDNYIPQLPELGDVQLMHNNELTTPETAVQHLANLLSVPQEVAPPHTSLLQEQSMFPGSQDPFLGTQVMTPWAASLDMATMFRETFYPGSVCLGSWNSQQLGMCHLFAVPSSTHFEGVPGAVIVGIMKGRPVWCLPQ